MNELKSFDVWLGVKLTVKYAAGNQGRDVWQGAAVVRGADWLNEAMQAAYLKSPDVLIAGPVVDLSDAAVRLLNREGDERRQATAALASTHGLPSDEPESSSPDSDSVAPPEDS